MSHRQKGWAALWFINLVLSTWAWGPEYGAHLVGVAICIAVVVEIVGVVFPR